MCKDQICYEIKQFIKEKSFSRTLEGYFSLHTPEPSFMILLRNFNRELENRDTSILKKSTPFFLFALLSFTT